MTLTTGTQFGLSEILAPLGAGGMGLHLSDCHLEAARLCLVTGERAQARAHWAMAQAMIARMGHHRRDKDVAEIGQTLGAPSGAPDAN